VGINHIQLVYHFGAPVEVTGTVPFNLSYQDLNIIPLLLVLLDVPGPLVITRLEWDWRIRTLEVWVRQEKAR